MRKSSRLKLLFFFFIIRTRALSSHEFMILRDEKNEIDIEDPDVFTQPARNNY